MSPESPAETSATPEFQPSDVQLAEVQLTEAIPESVVTVEPTAIVADAESSAVDAFQQLDPRWIQVEERGWWILTAILTLILSVFWLLVGFVFRQAFDVIQWLLLLVVLSVAALGLFASRAIPRWTFQSTTWRLRSNGLEIRRGIWWQHRIFIPRGQIQHTDVQQGPIMRMFGLAVLVVNTGGTHEPAIPLAGLGLATAESTRNQLTAPIQQPSGAERL